MATFIALLRAVNVGKRKVPMKDLAALARSLGFEEVRTYVASGNLIFTAKGKAEKIEATLDEAISKHFGFPVETIVRDAADWPALLAANPFAEETEKEPNRVQMLLAKGAIARDAPEALLARARHGERIVAKGGALWFHYPEGVGVSKVTPSAIDRACGSPATARNVRTVAKLGELAGVA